MFQSTTPFVNILLVDQDATHLDSLSRAISSPLIGLTAAHSYEEARRLIRGAGTQCHCCIMDLSRDTWNDGEVLTDCFRSFPFIIVISGLSSMRLAFKATKMGALEVFDKRPPEEMNEIIDKVYRTAVLGMLLNGQKTDYLRTFLTLKDDIVRTPQEWAEQSCIGLRYLERLCRLHIGMAPRYVLPLYYALCCSLYNDHHCPDPEYDYCWMHRFKSRNHSFLEKCIQFTQEHVNGRFRNMVSIRPTPVPA